MLFYLAYIMSSFPHCQIRAIEQQENIPRSSPEMTLKPLSLLHLHSQQHASKNRAFIVRRSFLAKEDAPLREIFPVQNFMQSRAIEQQENIPTSSPKTVLKPLSLLHPRSVQHTTENRAFFARRSFFSEGGSPLREISFSQNRSHPIAIEQQEKIPTSSPKSSLKPLSLLHPRSVQHTTENRAFFVRHSFFSEGGLPWREISIPQNFIYSIAIEQQENIPRSSPEMTLKPLSLLHLHSQQHASKNRTFIVRRSFLAKEDAPLREIFPVQNFKVEQ